MNTLLDPSNFPSMNRSVRAHWAPMLLSPISGSCERFVVGIAAVNSDGFHLEIANALERLQCLYGDDAAGAVNAVLIAGKYLESDLARRSIEAIVSPDPAISGISIGECREAEGLSLQSLAQSWMVALSSLHSAQNAQDGLTVRDMSELVAATDGTGSGDRLPFLVCDYVRAKRKGFGGYFSADLREGRAKRIKGGSHRVIIDFAGPKLVANFGTLKAGALTSSVHLIKRRLWDLKVERDKEPALHLSRVHEMILQRPPKNDPQVSEKQQANIAEAFAELENQADQEDLRLLALDSVQEIGNRILKYDVAA
jgi:hypothetical protein